MLNGFHGLNNAVSLWLKAYNTTCNIMQYINVCLTIKKPLYVQKLL